MRGLGTILAERRLGDEASGKVVRVSLGAPRPGTRGADWECPFRIGGAGISRLGYGYGIDSMQALTDAVEGIRVRLDESGLALGWWFGPGRDDIWSGETGFARSIPIGFGAAFKTRLERLVDRELRGYVQRLKARAARKALRTRKAATARNATDTRRTPAARKSRKAR